MTTFPDVAHIALTVTDLSVSGPWYDRLFGLEPAIDEDAGDFYHRVYVFPGGTAVGLHVHHGKPASGPFSEFSTGLDHLAFACSDRAELEEWARRLEELGIPHTGIQDHSYGSDISFRDPDNIALEFFAPPS